MKNIIVAVLILISGNILSQNNSSFSLKIGKPVMYEKSGNSKLFYPGIISLALSYETDFLKNSKITRTVGYSYNSYTESSHGDIINNCLSTWDLTLSVSRQVNFSEHFYFQPNIGLSLMKVKRKTYIASTESNSGGLGVLFNIGYEINFRIKERSLGQYFHYKVAREELNLFDVGVIIYL